MHLRRGLNLTALFLLASGSGCASRWLQLETEPGGTWSNGNPGYRRSADDIAVELYFAGVQDGLLVFEAEVTNTSTLALLEVSALSFSSMTDTRQNGLEAVDPEERLRAIASERSSALRGVVGTLDGITAIGDLVGSVADLGANDEEGVRKRSAERAARENDRLRRQEQERLRQAQLQQAEERWRNDYLRRTVLMPGERVRGYVAFPGQATPDASLVVRLEVPQRPAFDFTFRRVVPAPPRRASTIAYQDER